MKLSAVVESLRLVVGWSGLLPWTSLLVVCLQQVASVGGLDSEAPCSSGNCEGATKLDKSRPQQDQPASERQMAGGGECKYPCNCSRGEQCRFGVSQIKDGCDCCTMCARQQGDLCNYRDKCDDAKNLYCDMSLDGGIRGICRSRTARECLVNGEKYRDGQEFHPKDNCSLLCTCQDGRYACSSTCPQELRPPSAVHCRDAHLVKVGTQCCKEWVCPHSHSLVGPDDNYSNESPVVDRPQCKPESTEYSSCSQTCGLGVSIRMMVDPVTCQPRQEKRLCIVRPCETTPDSAAGDRPHHQPQSGGKGSCRSSWRDRDKHHIQFGKCYSVGEYQLKYCSTCKSRKCCAPEDTKTVSIEFKCGSGLSELITENFMFIKTCKCHKLAECPFL